MSKSIKLAIAFLFLIVLNVGVFSFNSISLTSFWICWVFMHIAFLVMVSVLIFSVPEQKQIKFAYSESAIAIYYFVVELVVGFALMFKFVALPGVVFAIHTVILVAFLVAFLSTKKMNSSIEKEETARAADLKQFNFILENMKDVLNQVAYTAPYKKTIEHVYDAMAGSQMRSSREVLGIEENILSLVNQLKQEVAGGNEEAISACCRNLETEIAQRNKILRLSR